MPRVIIGQGAGRGRRGPGAAAELSSHPGSCLALSDQRNELQIKQELNMHRMRAY